MQEVNLKQIRKCVNVLVAIANWAAKDASYGIPVMKIVGKQVVYNSANGVTVGIIFPTDLGFTNPFYIPVSTLKIALKADPKAFVVNPQNLTLNGIKLSQTESDAFAAAGLALDVNQVFGNVKTTVTVPIPDVLDDVSVAQAKNDVRYYLNGVCFDLDAHTLVATNGHRMHLANSDTLPTLDSDKLNALRVRASTDDKGAGTYYPVQLLLASWQVKLLKVIEATQLKIARFPERPKDLPEGAGGWSHPGKDSDAYLVRAKGAHGYIIGKSVDGRYPDWKRVLRPANAVADLRREALADCRSIAALELKAQERSAAWTIARQLELAKAWRTRYPRTITFGQGTADALRAYLKARNAELTGNAKMIDGSMGVRLDFKAGTITGHPESSVPLLVKFNVLDTFEYDPERDGEHLAAVQAQYLIDAIDYIGDAEWYVRQDGAWGATQGVRSCIVMTQRM